MCSIIILDTPSRRGNVLPIKKEKTSYKLSKEEIDKLNLTSVKNIAQKIIDGNETLYNSMYVQVYDWLKKHDKINLSENLRLEITTEAEQTILQERQERVDNLTASGNLSKARDVSKNMYDIEPDLAFYQKKIAIIGFLRDKNEMGISIDEIFNIEQCLT